MKGFRIFYYTLMFAALFYAQYSGNRICYLLFFIQLFTLLAAIGLNLWTIFSFSYVQKLSTPEAEKGQNVTLHLGIYNDKPFPFTHMKVHIEAPAPEDCQDIIINLAPQENVSFDFNFSLPYRGEFMVGMTRLDIQDLFGLFPMHIDMRWLSYYRQQPLLVYPHLLDFTLPPYSQNRSAGQNGPAALSSGGRDEFSHLRAWIPGDSSSRIHWKVSIKTRSLSTRQYEDPSGENCLIFIDTQQIKENSIVLADRITECAVSLTHAHLKQLDCTLLCCGDEKYTELKEAFSLTDFSLRHQWLALLPFRVNDENHTAERLLQLASQVSPDHIYIIGTYLNPALSQALAQIPVAAHYWTAAPLPDHFMPLSDHVQLASFHNKELLPFLHSQLGGDEQ